MIYPFDWNKLRLPFRNANQIKHNYSQEQQDLFVLSCLNGKPWGTFLDIGCNDPQHINNTYLLESSFGWTGLSIDINPEYTKKYNTRFTQVLTQDATTLDFENIKKLLNRSHIDYLSLDLEPPDITLKCLTTIPLDTMDFSVITFEHDVYNTTYNTGEAVRTTSREIFEKYGYKRICTDVRSGSCIFEDWYINPRYVDYNYVKGLERENATGYEMVMSH